MGHQCHGTLIPGWILLLGIELRADDFHFWSRGVGYPQGGISVMKTVSGGVIQCVPVVVDGQPRGKPALVQRRRWKIIIEDVGEVENFGSVLIKL